MSPSILNSLSEDAMAVSCALSAMVQEERSVCKNRDYLASTRNESRITAQDRTKMVDWCSSIAAQFRFRSDAVARTMDVADRFLASSSRVAREARRDRQRFQLVALTALYVVVKVHEEVVHGSASFSALSRGQYSARDIEEMELSMLQALEWRIMGPTSLEIAHHVLLLTLPRVRLPKKTWGFLLSQVQFQIAQAVRDYYFTTQRTSTVAVAAIMNVLDDLEYCHHRSILHALLPIVDEHFSPPEDLLATKMRLHDFVERSDGSSSDSHGSFETN